nr:cysteine protease StiP family protein [Tepiditoga spiralis]
MQSSYKSDDVIFLLKDISDEMKELPTKERERLIQSGKKHYSEMLPIEYEPGESYKKLFFSSLKKYKEKIALFTGILSEKIVSIKGKDIVLVSLARAGTPIGILVKRYIKNKFNLSIPHYSISIIRDRGIDEVALNKIIKEHTNSKIVFIDGWTGKGTIKAVLKNACNDFNLKYKTDISDELAVLADPCGCAEMSGTKEDFLIPSSCLNSVVSGLVSRTVLNDFIKENEYHGAKFYKNLKEFDLSNYYIDEIEKEFIKVLNLKKNLSRDEVNWNGKKEVDRIEKEFKVTNRNFIKPGIGETTRVLLRRIPDIILVNNYKDEDLEHIFILAKEKKVKVIEYPLRGYKCCGIIKKTGDA